MSALILSAVPDHSVRLQQGAVVCLALLVPVLATLPGLRPWILGRPGRSLLALVLVDFLYMVWATTPYVPYGIDESFFLINSYVYTGSDLFVMFVRPPLPGLGAALFPFHPPLLGLLLKGATTLLVFRLAVRPLGTNYALLVAWLTTVSSLLCHWSAYTLSEPYGAALLTAFVFMAARGATAWLGLVAGIAFLARYPLGILLPFAVLLAWRRSGWRRALFACVLFLLPAIIALPLTGADPLQVLADRGSGYADKSILYSLWFHLKPGRALGLGLLGMLVAALGAWQLRRVDRRSPELICCFAVFVTFTAAMVLMGETTLRFFAPLAPLGALMIACGCRALQERSAALRRAPIAGLCAGLLAAQICIPVHPPKIRALRLASRGEVVRQHKAEILSIVGDHHLYTDFDFVVLTAILRHPCPAVPQDHNVNHKHHPPGVGLYFPGFFPPVDRSKLAARSFYLTYEPAGRPVLWRGADLHLVRW